GGGGRDAGGLAHDLLVVADGMPLAVPLALRTARAEVPVGDALWLLVAGGYAETPVVIERFVDGRRAQREVLPGGRAHLRRIAVGDALRGGFALRAASVRDHQLLAQQASVAVPSPDLRLALRLERVRDRLQPGTEETWTLIAEPPRGGANGLDLARVELLAAMVDASLARIAPHDPADPVDWLAPARVGATLPPIVAGLGTARPLWFDRASPRVRPFAEPPLRGDRLAFLDRVRVGGPGYGRPTGIARVQTEAAAMPRAMRAAPAAAPMAAMDAAADDAGAPLAQSAGAPPNDPGSADPIATVAPMPADPVRRAFDETAFWRPQLRLDDDGRAQLTFTVPDAVTAWDIWLRAHSAGPVVYSGALAASATTARTLLVRPQLPRFLRTGDTATVAVVIDNAGDVPLRGTLRVTAFDPADDADRTAALGLDDAPRPFVAPARGSVTVDVPLRAPERIGPLALRAIGRAAPTDRAADAPEAFADGEIRPLPILPRRVHLAQSRTAVLRRGPTDDDRRATLRFDDLARDDDAITSEQLVVRVDAQLGHAVLDALPALIDDDDPSVLRWARRVLAAGVARGIVAR
ncbi:MAG: alpha-2-macroglobulin family protein, partial [Acidobacteriota bacterium]